MQYFSDRRHLVHETEIDLVPFVRKNEPYLHFLCGLSAQKIHVPEISRGVLVLKEMRSNISNFFFKKYEIWKFWTECLLSGNGSIASDLFDTMIKPILLHSSDFWWCLKLPKENPIDKLHIMFCKQILGVQKQTTNISVLHELGRILFNIYACKFSIKNWERNRRNW